MFKNGVAGRRARLRARFRFDSLEKIRCSFSSTGIIARDGELLSFRRVLTMTKALPGDSVEKLWQ